MALPTNEQTQTQNAGWWGRFGTWAGNRLGWQSQLPEVKAVVGSGAAEGKNPYELAWQACGVHGSDIRSHIYPGTFATYDAMEADPAIAIAKAAVVLTIMAAEWLAEVDDDLPEDVANFGKEIIERELKARRAEVLSEALEAVFIGFQPFECVYTLKSTRDGKPYTGCEKVKALGQTQTIAQIDDKGNFIGAKNGAAELRGPAILWIVYGKRKGNFYGRGRYENDRRPWSNKKTLEDRKMLLVRLGTGIIVKIGYPADSEEDKKAGRHPNRDAALALARNLSDGNSVVYENFVGVDPEAVIREPKLAGASNVSIETIDLGDPGPRIAAIGAEQDRLDKALVRGLLLPERTIIEATMGGSRADSETHGDIALADAEATHELIVQQINDQLVAALIRENCGEQYVGRIRLAAAPIQDEQKRQLSADWAALISDPQFRAMFVDAIGEDGLQSMLDRLGSGHKLANPIDPLRPESDDEETAPSDTDPDERDEDQSPRAPR